MAKLHIRQKGNAIEKPLFKALTTIGSDPHADIVLLDPLLPKVVGHITQHKGMFFLSSSTQPSMFIVNQMPVTRHLLQHQDEILIGSTTLAFDESTQEIEHNLKSTEASLAREMAAYARLLNFSQVLSQEHRIPHLLEVLMDEIIALTGAENGFLVLLENQIPVVKVARNHQKEIYLDKRYEKSDSILKKVIATQQPVLVNDALHDSEFSASSSVVNFRLSSVMCAPLLYLGRLIGAIYVGNNSAKNAFDRKSLDILAVFAAQASLIVQNALHIDALVVQTNELKAKLEHTRFGELIGSCPGMQEVFRQIGKLASANVSVLIWGETGTGKELIARELHQRSLRCDKPFVIINCGAIPENLLESELFGHVRGAFTGANTTRIGRFQAAHGGSLFLDEIGEMPLHLQVKILRALQEHRITKVGDTKSEPMDIRVIAATHRNLLEMVQDGSFREDLYYRLNVVQIDVPPLRERGNDVLIIGNYFLQKYCKVYSKESIGFSETAQNALLNYRWPGNVRQLENRIKRAIVLCEGQQLSPQDLDLPKDAEHLILTLTEAIERFRRNYVREALERNAGNRTKAAKELGVDPRTIFRHLESEKRGEA